MRRLLSHLAQFSSFSRQGELLCTQGLAYLLENADARAAFSLYIENRSGAIVSRDLTWRAEVQQRDGGRPDLEACTAAGKPVVKIEAKLGAAFGDGQLRSYAIDQQSRSTRGILLVLVPRHRAEEVKEAVGAMMPGATPVTRDETEDPLHTEGCTAAIVYWEEVLDVLAGVSSESFRNDLEQFRAMYRVLNGYDIEPVASAEELGAWRQREGVFITLVDRVTRRLTQHHNVLPMSADDKADPKGYIRRYVCRPLSTKTPCFSIGVRDFFRGYSTPIWLRFHRDTAMFGIIRARLGTSPFSQRLVDSGGHVWLPLEVPLGVDGERLVDSLVAQAESIVRVAYEPQDRSPGDVASKCRHGLDPRFCAACGAASKAVAPTNLTEVLLFLNEKTLRATYGAVAESIGAIPQSMGERLGDVRVLDRQRGR